MKKYLFLLLSLCFVVFVSCENGSNSTSESSDEKTTITINSMPEGVYAIEIGPGTGIGFNSYATIKHDDLPYTRVFSSKEFAGSGFPEAGSTFTVKLSYDWDYGSIKGEEPLKVLNNGSVLEEQMRTIYSADFKDEDKKEINLQQYQIYIAEMTLAENNDITFDEGSFGIIDASKVRLINSAGYSYVYCDNKDVNLQNNSFGIVYDKMFYVNANKNETGYLNPHYGYWFEDLSNLVCKYENKSIHPQYSENNGQLVVYFTSAPESEVAVISGLELAPIQDKLGLAGKTFNSTFYKEDSTAFEDYSGKYKIEFGSFTPGSTKNPVTVTENGEPHEGIWYYTNLNTVRVSAEYGNPFTTIDLKKTDNSYVGTPPNKTDSQIYFSDKAILGIEKFNFEYKKDQNRLKLYWTEEDLEFLGFEPDLSVGTENVFENLEIYIDDSVANRYFFKEGDSTDTSKSTDKSFYTCYFDINPISPGSLQFDPETMNCDKEHTCYIKYGDVKSETIKFVKNSEYTFKNVKAVSVPEHAGDPLSITYEANKSDFDLYVIVKNTQTNTTNEYTYIDVFHTLRFGRIDFSTMNLNSGEYDISVYAESPESVKVIKQPIYELKSLALGAMAGTFTLTEENGVPETLSKEELSKTKFKVKLNFEGCNPYIDCFTLTEMIYYHVSGDDPSSGRGIGHRIEAWELKDNSYILDMTDPLWDLIYQTRDSGILKKDIYKFTIETEICGQRSILTYNIE